MTIIFFLRVQNEKGELKGRFSLRGYAAADGNTKKMNCQKEIAVINGIKEL
jgi:aspartate carbamoyltransferase catalytic subunit